MALRKRVCASENDEVGQWPTRRRRTHFGRHTPDCNETKPTTLSASPPPPLLLLVPLLLPRDSVPDAAAAHPRCRMRAHATTHVLPAVVRVAPPEPGAPAAATTRARACDPAAASTLPSLTAPPPVSRQPQAGMRAAAWRRVCVWHRRWRLA